MNDLLTRLSSYNLLNYLLPGVIFVAGTEAFTRFTFVQDDLLLGVFVYYFIGISVSRFGSLVVEPLLKRVSIIKFSDYDTFVLASKVDPKIEILSEANNTYRSLFSALLLIVVLIGWQAVESQVPHLSSWAKPLLVLLLLLLFLGSYAKQNSYVSKRIEANQPGD